MLQTLKTLIAPLASLFFMMMGSGLFNTFISLKLEMDGTSPGIIGVVVASLYVGILIGSLRIDRWISKVGLSRAFVFLGAALAALVLLQSFWTNPWYWASLRIVGGICSAGILIVIESWLLIQSPPNMRGGILSIYLAVLYGSLACGQLLIDVSDPNGILPYCVTALFVIFSILPITMTKLLVPKLEETAVRLNLPQLFKISPLGFVGGVISGMLLAVIYGLVPLYAKEVGMNVSEIGTFMAVLIFGGFSLQWPVGRWADQGNRRKVINVISFMTTLIGVSIAFVEQTWLLFGLAWLFGGVSFTLYPLCMAYTCERVKGNEIVAVTGGFVLSYGIGAIAGPLLAPIAMGYFGSVGIFYFIALMSLILGIVGLRKPAPVLFD